VSWFEFTVSKNVYSSTCYERESLSISGKDFLLGESFTVTQPAVSKLELERSTRKLDLVILSPEFYVVRWLVETCLRGLVV